MEIKGGSDISNAHNRVGEAEKSHIKARQAHFEHRWTLIALTGLDRDRITRESPSTTQFFDYGQISAAEGSDWESFRARLLVALGIPSQS